MRAQSRNYDCKQGLGKSEAVSVHLLTEREEAGSLNGLCYCALANELILPVFRDTF